MPEDSFRALFQHAMGRERKPYPYQELLARTPTASRLVHIPTGAGKTAAAILAWLWQRRVNPHETPRRLVYCLPMRVLVEQTRDNARRWLKKLGLEEAIRVHILMGGEEPDDWDLYPEREAILVGTQDMLLSRALNRGYGMSRYRWPMHFGLLHTDCLWVFDEIQLMGSGLSTTAQLEAFRAALGQKGCQSFWMSATLHPDWLQTVDFDPKALPLTKLEEDDLATGEVRQGYEAHKPLRTTGSGMADSAGLAKEIVKHHRKVGGRTLAIVNTVARARELHLAVQRQLKTAGMSLEPALIHSRFRPTDRARQIERLVAEPSEGGTIVVSTQVVEAGVDISARTLFTELAPWPSLVQRFGRCNRRGLENDTASVFWLDLPKSEKQRQGFSAPYALDDLLRSRELLRSCDDVGPASLAGVDVTEHFEHGQVIRHKDFIELFDTTPDLAGNDVDVEPYVREVDECDVQVFWRNWPLDQIPADDVGAPCREELCAVPVSEFRSFVQEADRRKLAYRWDYLDRQWARAVPNRIYPGQIYLLHASSGGYGPNAGWNAAFRETVPLAEEPVSLSPLDANDEDLLSEIPWQSVAEHTDGVCGELRAIVDALSLPESRALELAARWHDRGKAHEVFQNAIRNEQGDGGSRPDGWADRTDIGKAPSGWWNKYERKHFRHELASALAILIGPNGDIAQEMRDLVAYLVAAHHGKVRLSIRSLPGEQVPADDRRFARGIWHGEKLPATDLGGGVLAPEVTLSLEPMELGLCEDPPFAGQPSWAERMLTLRDKLGPLRLAYLEAVLRAADARASRISKKQGPNHA